MHDIEEWCLPLSLHNVHYVFYTHYTVGLQEAELCYIVLWLIYLIIIR